MKTSRDILQEGRAILEGAMMRSGSAAHIILPCFLAHGSGRDIPKVLATRQILVFFIRVCEFGTECMQTKCLHNNNQDLGFWATCWSYLQA